MAFKMKAGKEGPMKKNFPSVFKNTTVEVGDNQITATKKGLTVTGPGGKISKYKPNTAGYDAAKQQYIDAGGESPMNLGSSTGMSGAQGRPKNVKPGGVDIDGNYVTEGGRRTYTPASVGTVSAMNMKKSAMKAAKPDFPDIDGDGNTTESMKKAAADKKSANKMKKAPMKMKKAAMKLKKSAMEMKKAGMKMKKESAMMLKKSAMEMKKASAMKMGHKSPKKLNRGGYSGRNKVGGGFLEGGKNR